jgi:hypothetical protein
MKDATNSKHVEIRQKKELTSLFSPASLPIEQKKTPESDMALLTSSTLAISVKRIFHCLGTAQNYQKMHIRSLYV